MVGADWDKAHKKAAIDLFRLVQIYMGDRKARPGMTLNSVAQDILHTTYANEKWVWHALLFLGPKETYDINT